VVRADSECTTLGGPSGVDRTRAVAALSAVESAAVAREFWTGDLAASASWDDGPVLDDLAVDVTPGSGALSIRVAVALLEEQLLDRIGAGLGCLHMTRRALQLAFDVCGFRREVDLILSPLDVRVVADAGYPGTGLGGDAPDAGEQWVFASARPSVRFGDVLVEDVVDPATNRRFVSAARLAVLSLPASAVAACTVTLT
jgi:hypothetical protein